jgi:hypothetical protein
MRRVFGVAVLAAVPIACGTVPTLPTASSPDEVATAETFAASGRIAPICSEKADWSSVKGVVVRVARRDRGSVTVRTDLLIIGSNGPTPCYTPVFSVKPSGRGILLQPGANPREATLRAPTGSYEITAIAEGPVKPAHTGSLMLELPGK